MSCAFLTQLHSDHTTGYPDLIFTAAVTGRTEPLDVFGPKGLSAMTNHIITECRDDLEERERWSVLSNKRGYIVNTHEIGEGVIYEDTNITVEAFLVNHSSLEAYGFKFIAEDRYVVISGNTCHSPKLIAKAKECDVLIHEVYTAVGLKEQSEEWQKCHSAVHTSTYALADIATLVKPTLLIPYHQLRWARTDDELLSEVTNKYDGRVVSGKDLDVFEI
jgi:ribonuclease BN (tRNA processing enzyme)